jgi:MoaA/NifB/PqqE/SkfB family radical SAM enzyme
MTFDSVKKKLDINPFYFTKAIEIETHNRCNYANWHTRCPIASFKEKIIMPMEKIGGILEELGKYDFDGTIYPFNYSEPLIDPRMFKIIELIKWLVPKAPIALYTNGFMVDEIMLRELQQAGVARVNISIYTPEDGIYFHELLCKLRVENFPMILRAYQRYPMEERMNDKKEWYDANARPLKRGCPSPYKYLTITANGEMVLCCHDWKSMHVFGSIYESSLVDIIKSDKAIQTFTDLCNWERDKYYLCARCKKHR